MDHAGDDRRRREPRRDWQRVEGQGLGFLVSRVGDSPTYSGRGIRLATLLIAHLCPIDSLFAPRDPGAAPRIFVTESLTRDTSAALARRVANDALSSRQC